jgi:anti-sigma regulatory factor (Ser/Thr protein kinase)
VNLRVTAQRDVIRIEVSDDGSRPFGRDHNGGRSGWGLGLIGEFSDRFAIEHHPSTKVWCEFDLAG